MCDELLSSKTPQTNTNIAVTSAASNKNSSCRDCGGYIMVEVLLFMCGAKRVGRS